MIVEEEVRRNSNAIAGLNSAISDIKGHLLVVEKDIKSLLKMNGCRQGKLGLLEGRLGVVFAIVLSILASGASVIAVILSR